MMAMVLIFVINQRSFGWTFPTLVEPSVLLYNMLLAVFAALLAALPKAPSRYNPVKDPKEAKFRRDLVIRNLLDNNYIDEDQFKSISNSKIILNKRKKIYLEDARYYVEDIRKDVVKKFVFEKVYKKGLNIKTPLNL